MAERIEEMFVEVGAAFQKELIERMLAFIRDERKQRSMWVKAKRWLASIKHCKCVCGAAGVGCECARPEPPEVVPKRLRVVQSNLHGCTRVDSASAPTDLVVPGEASEKPSTAPQGLHSRRKSQYSIESLLHEVVQETQI
jgi:hypothetical protein